MKSLYEKYQSNKHLFVIPLLILVSALYFIPVLVQFEYSFQYNNETITQPTYYSGWFYGWSNFERIASYNNSIGRSNAQTYMFCILPIISTLIACISALLSYKHACFVLGALLVPMQNFIYIGLYRDALTISAKENIYLVFSIVLNIVAAVFIMFLFCLPFSIKEKPHKPKKTDRIAELEKQVAELQSKLPSEND